MTTIALNNSISKKIKLRLFLKRFYKRRISRTISYRISASLIAQIVSWILFQELLINGAVLFADSIQFIWYYIHDWLVLKVTDGNLVQ